MRHIEIQTHLKGKEPNSFTLTVDGENYLYFSEIDLLLGFMARVGTCNNENADRSTLMNSLFNVMLGEKYANDIDKLNQTVQRMTERYNDKIKKLDNEIHRFQDAADEYEKFKKKLEETTEKIKAMESSYKEACVPYLDYKHRIVMLESSLSRVEQQFKKADIEEKASNIKASKKEKKEKPAKEAKTKTKTTRQKRDEAILKGIEEKAKDNPNIK